jgi:regulatory subunit for Cdc7p protein kinase
MPPLPEILRIINQLYIGDSPLKAVSAKGHSLPFLLRAEALSGITHERDPQVLRPDFTYFAPRNHYLLVEDASGEHKTLISKEYERPRRGEAYTYPILHGGVEGRGAFSSRDQTIPPLPPGTAHPPIPIAVHEPETMPPPAPLSRQPSNGASGLAVNSLRKVTMMNQFAKKQQAQEAPEAASAKDEAHGFLAASGNSQIITSNIASMTSGAVLPTNIARQDNRLAILDRRQIVTNQSAVAGARVGLGVPMIKSKPVVLTKPIRKTKSKTLGGLRNPNPNPPYEADKPGYCENCRLRYTNFRDVSLPRCLPIARLSCPQHIASRKHRRFAQKRENWAELDDFLRGVARADVYGKPMLDFCVLEAPSPVAAMDADEFDQSDSEEDEENGSVTSSSNDEVEAIELDEDEEAGTGSEEAEE